MTGSASKKTSTARIPTAFAGILAMVLPGCGREGRPAGPTTPVVVAVPAPSPAPSPSPRATNAAPEIAGDRVCISPIGDAHVFDLTFSDADGDVMRWEAARDHARGSLTPAAGAAVVSGTVVRIVYAPPAGVPDDNRITLVVTDAYGAATTAVLTVRNY